MKKAIIYILVLLGISLNYTFAQTPRLPIGSSDNFDRIDLSFLNNYTTEDRDSIVIEMFMNGSFPKFLEELSRVNIQYIDSLGNQKSAYYYVTSDYIALGNEKDFVRIPMTPNYAQKLADKLGMYLITTKISDDVFNQAAVKIEPIPMGEPRTLFQTFVVHNDLIEKERKDRRGLIAGIKKDIIATSRLNAVNNKVAIYGWHKSDGVPIQPLYIKHADYYVDYSHGIRLVYPYVFIDNEKIHFDEILKDTNKRFIISNEFEKTYYKYAY